MPNIVHFEIASSEVTQAAQFYAEVFGWTAEPSPFVAAYTMLRGAGHATGAVMSAGQRGQKVIVWFEVPKLENALEAVASAGGSQTGEINTIPGEGRVVYAADPEGTIFGLKEPA